MKKLKRLYCLIPVFILSLSVGLAQSELSKETEMQNQIVIGEIHKLSSTFLNEERTIFVHLPVSYKNETAKQASYPVVYLLDAEYNFNSFSTMLGHLAGPLYGKVPEMIVVSIKNTDRTRDLTPTNFLMQHPKDSSKFVFETSGGADRFLQFIQEELKPYINNNFRTKNYEILVGHSLGGLFTIHTLLHHPDYFEAYVAQDPSLWWDNNFMINKTKNALLADRNLLKDKKLFVSQATSEKLKEKAFYDMWQPIQDFKAILEDLKSTHFRHQLYKNETHGTIPLVGNYDAMRWLFEENKPVEN